MNPIMWIALSLTVLMIAGHVFLFWWFVARRGRAQVGGGAKPLAGKPEGLMRPVEKER